MPTADQRLDQLEPVISEMLARQDELSAKQDELSARQDELGAKVERVSAQVRQLTVTVTNSLTVQSSNIEFLLIRTDKLEQNQIELQNEMDRRFNAVDQRFDQLFDFLKEKLK
jgi:chromosome segregation ATPase